MILRAVSWFSIAKAGPADERPLRRRDVTSATMIGVLMRATLPARLGEPARAMVLSRRTGRMRETFPVLLGTLVSQTALNILAIVLLGVIIVSVDGSVPLESERLFLVAMVPLLSCCGVVAGADDRAPRRQRRVAEAGRRSARALLKVRMGLVVFRDPRHGTAGRPSPALGLGPAAGRLLGVVRSARSERRRASAPPPRSSSPSTSPPWFPLRRRTSASSSSP